MDEDTIEIYEEMIQKQFFIDPNGKIKKWRWGLEAATEWVSLHAGIAERLCPDNIEHPTDYLHNLGWIAIGSSAYGNRVKNEPTQAQINTLYDLGYRRIRDDNGVLYKW